MPDHCYFVVLPLFLSERHIEETAQRPGKENKLYFLEQNISEGNIQNSEISFFRLQTP